LAWARQKLSNSQDKSYILGEKNRIEQGARQQSQPHSSIAGLDCTALLGVSLKDPAQSVFDPFAEAAGKANIKA